MSMSNDADLLDGIARNTRDSVSEYGDCVAVCEMKLAVQGLSVLRITQ